jgi:ADP-ribosylglycohydrolase
MPGWNRLSHQIEQEFIQSLEEGKDTDAIKALRREYEGAIGNDSTLARIHADLVALPVREDFPYREPNDLAEIRALRQGQVELDQTPFSDGELLDRLHGAWLGRCVGCALGKPVECAMAADGNSPSWQRIRNFLQRVSPDEWPLRDYFPEGDIGGGNRVDGLSTRERISHMEPDDDIQYTVLGQIILERFGANFTTWNVGAYWIRHLPYNLVCTAETHAYRNLVSRYDFHKGSDWGYTIQDVDWDWVATYQNPYREWIGAQIRVDSYGYAAPGRPELAAEFGWRDARLSHTKNGIYGAMFCAAMIAAAFRARSARELVEAALAQIPATSRLHEDIVTVMGLCAKFDDDAGHFEEIIGQIYQRFGHYSAVHTNNNATLCVLAVLLSRGDFSLGVTLAVMGGWDTDCNGATVGSIVGAMTGAARVPEHWTGRLHDTLKSKIIDYHPIAISECARRSVAIARRIQETP